VPYLRALVEQARRNAAHERPGFAGLQRRRAAIVALVDETSSAKRMHPFENGRGPRVSLTGHAAALRTAVLLDACNPMCVCWRSRGCGLTELTPGEAQQTALARRESEHEAAPARFTTQN